MTMGDTRGEETEAGTREEEEDEAGKLHIAREESQSYVTQENDDRSDITVKRFLNDTNKSNNTHTSCLTTYKDNNTKKDDLTGATGRRSEEHSNEDIASYARSTINEMLGWYGLHDTSNNGIMYDRDLSPRHVEGQTGSPPYPANTPADDDILLHKNHHLHQDEDPSSDTVQPILISPCENQKVKIDGASLGNNANNFRESLSRMDGPSIQSIPPPPMPFEGLPNQPLHGNSQDKKMGGRKLIGMRYLFPPPSEGLSLLEKARIWVARHDYKYFVGWNEDQLSQVNGALRPICAITPDLYKMHMNRSEYCRNVKLKYCLESDADWAKEFREKLAKPYNKGGFSGLCQAKIVAAELWRKHSANYKSHQARYPNPKSKYKARRMSSGLDQPSNPADNMFSIPSAEFLKYNQDTTLIYQRTDTIKASEPARVMRFMKSTLGGCDDSRDNLLGNCLSTELTNRDVLDVNDVRKVNQEGETETSATAISMVRVKEEIPFTLDNHEDSAATSALDESVRMAYPVEPYRGHQQFLPPPVRDNYVSSSLYYYGASAAATDTASVASQIKKNISGGRNNDYRKSERGLSYLFPSLIDQQLSLLDKVRITVLRHKNNYFLGWTEDQLKRVDPLVRPKMPVTRELYKEYCHRNAMKYDSNLQFAMESQTSWAVEFRDRLVKPPNEGGFHSLCEVKQEAGRLWKEFSGRYKMHNVVKAQMDMNNEQVKTPALLVERSEFVCSSNFDDTTDFRSTTSSPGPRLDRITSPIRKFISRSANSSPTLGCEEPMLRYPTADFPPDLHGSRKRKQSNDSGCASLPSPSNGAVDTDIYKHNFAPRHFAVTGETVRRGDTPVKVGFAFRDAIPNDGYLGSKFPRLERPTHSTASEVTNSMLFAPLPLELSVVNQLLIWRQRHRNNYFIGWSQAQLDKLNPFLRPLYVVSSEVLKSHVSPTMFAMFDKVEEVIASDSIWAKNYQDKLGLPTEKGGFRTIEEALTDAMDIWTTYCQPRISPPQEKDVQNPGLLKLKDMFRAKSTQQSHDLVNATAVQVDPNNTLEGLLHTKPRPRADNSEARSNLMVLQGTEMPPADDTVLDLSKKHSATNSSKVRNQDSAVTDTLGLKAGLVTNLWNCRRQMQEVCRDSVASSWRDRLQPHLDLLHEKLGENYQLPTSVSDCMVDLMLVLLHESLTNA